MENLLKYLPSIKTITGLAAFCAIVVYGFQDTLIAAMGAEDTGSLALILFFLAFLLISVLGIATFYAISEKEIAAEATPTNTTKLKRVKKSKVKQRGKGGLIYAEDVDETEVEQDSGEINKPNDDSKKKA